MQMNSLRLWQCPWPSIDCLLQHTLALPLSLPAKLLTWLPVTYDACKCIRYAALGEVSAYLRIACNSMRQKTRTDLACANRCCNRSLQTMGHLMMDNLCSKHKDARQSRQVHPDKCDQRWHLRDVVDSYGYSHDRPYVGKG